MSRAIFRTETRPSPGPPQPCGADRRQTRERSASRRDGAGAHPPRRRSAAQHLAEMGKSSRFQGDCSSFAPSASAEETFPASCQLRSLAGTAGRAQTGCGHLQPGPEAPHALLEQAGAAPRQHPFRRRRAGSGAAAAPRKRNGTTGAGWRLRRPGMVRPPARQLQPEGTSARQDPPASGATAGERFAAGHAAPRIAGLAPDCRMRRIDEPCSWAACPDRALRFVRRGADKEGRPTDPRRSLR